MHHVPCITAKDAQPSPAGAGSCRAKSALAGTPLLAGVQVFTCRVCKRPSTPPTTKTCRRESVALHHELPVVAPCSRCGVVTGCPESNRLAAGSPTAEEVRRGAVALRQEPPSGVHCLRVVVSGAPRWGAASFARRRKDFLGPGVASIVGPQNPSRPSKPYGVLRTPRRNLPPSKGGVHLAGKMPGVSRTLGAVVWIVGSLRVSADSIA